MSSRRAIPFSALAGWDDGEAEALLSGLRRHFAPAVAGRPHQAPWLGAVDRALGPAADRARVEAVFQPFRIDAPGFLTGYYEPVIPASRVIRDGFRVPLYRRPPDLVRVHPASPDLPGDGTWARRREDGALEPYPDRAAIAAGALANRGLELAFVADPVDAFFAQVQGSARLRLEDGTEVRIGYHGKSGHPYTAIGRVLIDRGVLPEGGATMQTIRAALAAHPAIVPEVLGANRSYVFFRERPCAGAELGPIAGGGVPLVPWRSLAVDRAHIALGTPVHIETVVPGVGPVARVTLAEDTGSAIVGPARGDLFFGSGAAAGDIAGAMKASATLTVLLPRTEVLAAAGGGR